MLNFFKRLFGFQQEKPRRKRVCHSRDTIALIKGMYLYGLERHYISKITGIPKSTVNGYISGTYHKDVPPVSHLPVDVMLKINDLTRHEQIFRSDYLSMLP